MIFCVEPWAKSADGSGKNKTDSKCDEQSLPKPKQHAPNAIQQMSNAPSVDKKSSSKKVSVSFGVFAPLAVGSRRKKNV